MWYNWCIIKQNFIELGNRGSFFHENHGNLDPQNPNKMTILSVTIF